MSWITDHITYINKDYALGYDDFYEDEGEEIQWVIQKLYQNRSSPTIYEISDAVVPEKTPEGKWAANGFEAHTLTALLDLFAKEDPLRGPSNPH